MSDCSTRAWNLQSENTENYLVGFNEGLEDVEERLKHLRELNQQYQQIVLRFEIDDTKDRISTITRVEINDHSFVPEQRNQKLAQIAKELNDCLYEALMGARPNGNPPDYLIDKAELLDGMLRDLGVNLDD